MYIAEQWKLAPWPQRYDLSMDGFARFQRHYQALFQLIVPVTDYRQTFAVRTAPADQHNVMIATRFRG